MRCPDFRDLLFQAPDPIVVCNERGEIAFANSSAYPTFGYETFELLGESTDKLFAEGSKAEFERCRSQCFRGRAHPQCRSTVLLVARHRDGREFPVEADLSAVSIRRGLFVFVAIRDVSARPNGLPDGGLGPRKAAVGRREAIERLEAVARTLIKLEKRLDMRSDPMDRRELRTAIENVGKRVNDVRRGIATGESVGAERSRH